MEYRNTDLNELRNTVRIARYDVDPVAVADAIVRRRWTVATVSHPGIGSAGSARRRSRARVSCIARRGRGSRMRALAA